MNEETKEQDNQNEARTSVSEGAHDRLLCDGLNNTAKQIHEVAKSKGFWDSERNVGELLMLCVSELGEALEAHRKSRFTYNTELNIVNNVYKENIGSWVSEFEQCIKDSFQDEIADTIIRLLDLAAGLNIDIEKHMQLKFAYNQTRKRLHGKAY